MRARVVTPTNVVGRPDKPRPTRRQTCAVPWCKHVARDDGRCWTHRADVRKLRAVARLAAGMSVADVASEVLLSKAEVSELAMQVRDLEDG